MKALVLNCGSSSLKFAVFNNDEQLASGNVDSLSSEVGHFKGKLNGEVTKFDFDKPSHLTALQLLEKYLADNELAGFDVVGHRVVHGGEKFSGSVLINDEVMQVLRDVSHLAPLHNPANILGIEEAQKMYPELPQVAVFDTAFHQSIPKEAFLYGLPMKLYREQGVRRYGFHGTSHRYISMKMAEVLNKPANEVNIIVAHLGNGSSATAVRNGQSVDTTMGMTPLEGLVMGTRSGTIDPGLFAFLNNSLGMDVPAIDKMLNKESGLLGLSELSNDMRTLVDEAEAGHEGAQTAIDVMAFNLSRHLGALAVSLPKIDALVFTGGIGENNPGIRKKVLEQLQILGFQVDEKSNLENGEAKGGLITTENSTAAYVVATNEELLIAMDSAEVAKTLEG